MRHRTFPYFYASPTIRTKQLKIMYFKKLLTSGLATFFLLTSTASFAQDDNTIYMDEAAFNEALSNAGGSLENLSERLAVLSENALSSNGGGTSSDTDVPVDGGLSFLLAAGLGYGANRLRKQRQNRKSDLQ